MKPLKALLRTGLVFALGVAAMAMGCNGSTSALPTAMDLGLLDGTAWTAESIAGVRALPVAEPTIWFDDMGVRGSTGCNEWSGRPTFGAGGAFTISEISTTKRACENPVAIQETAFLAALRGARSITLDGERLLVRGIGGDIALHAGVGLGG